MSLQVWAAKLAIGTRVALPAMLLGLMAASSASAPNYTADGDLVVRGDYREWIYLSTGFDMNYSAGAPMQGQPMFDNVFVDPASWQIFKRTAQWPDGSIFAMEGRAAASHGSINRNGQYQTADMMEVEFHVRDEARFKGGWAFFVRDNQGRAKLVPATAACYTCHRQNGALDTTFTQFYPTARALAMKAGTYTGP